MNWIQAIILAILQGITELFPVSSLGHSVIIPKLFGWGDIQSKDTFLPFVVTLHLGTAIALLFFFWRDWVDLIKALGITAYKGKIEADKNGKLAWLVVTGTLPAGLLGLFLAKYLQSLFGFPVIAAAFLILNGSILFFGERVRRRGEAAASGTAIETNTMATAGVATTTDIKLRTIESLTFIEAIVIGFAQALALIPGISRSGITMVASLKAGLSHEDAARYTFLLSTPLIFAAGVLEIPQLFGAGSNMLIMSITAGFISAIAAYLSVRYLMKYFETGRLDPFAYYCWAAGAVSLLIILFAQ